MLSCCQLLVPQTTFQFGPNPVLLMKKERKYALFLTVNHNTDTEALNDIVRFLQSKKDIHIYFEPLGLKGEKRLHQLWEILMNKGVEVSSLSESPKFQEYGGNLLFDKIATETPSDVRLKKVFDAFRKLPNLPSKDLKLFDEDRPAFFSKTYMKSLIPLVVADVLNTAKEDYNVVVVFHPEENIQSFLQKRSWTPVFEKYGTDAEITSIPIEVITNPLSLEKQV